MPQLRDFLSRFRPAGAPGAARAPVPAEQHRRLETELGPVLMLLDGPDAECTRIIAGARRDAAVIVAAARADAAALEADARQRSAAVRRQSADEMLAAARAEAADITASAARQAARTRERASQRTPELAQRAVALVRDLQDAGDAPPARRDDPPGTPGRRS